VNVVALEREERRVADGPASRAQANGAAAEPELLGRARAGDIDAYGVLFGRHVGRVHAVCRRLTGDPTVAEDLTQEVFVHAWERLGTFRGESAFSTWLHPLTVNLALTHLRTRRRALVRLVAQDDETPFDPPTPPPQRELRLALEAAIDRLPPGAREIFVLHDVEGYRHDEIAALLGVAVGTSKAQLHRARRLLREALQ
jgi:RNA polymerase sigma-70 factor (ECF subfamily)